MRTATSIGRGVALLWRPLDVVESSGDLIPGVVFKDGIQVAA